MTKPGTVPVTPAVEEKRVTLNIDLAEKVLDQIRTHPETHDQAHWLFIPEADGGCGTTRCVAGWALALSGEQFEYAVAPLEVWGAGVGRDISDLQGGRSIEEVAMELLGLTYKEADDLFCCNDFTAVEMLEGLIKDARSEAKP